jgi:hypothetical protein
VIDAAPLLCRPIALSLRYLAGTCVVAMPHVDNLDDRCCFFEALTI